MNTELGGTTRLPFWYFYNTAASWHDNRVDDISDQNTFRIIVIPHSKIMVC
jgi:hypothetical protein